MKKVILLALLMPLPAFGQIVENFESQSIPNWVQSTEGHWKADTASSLSGLYSLHHIFDNPDAGSDQTGIRISNLHPSDDITSWSFLLRYGYDPSSQNNWSVFLMSDSDPANMNTSGTTHGFAIGVDLIGSDDTLRIWRIDGSEVISVVNSGINWQNDIGSVDAVRITVERSQEGSWTISVKNLAGELIGIASGADKQLFNPAWFGIYYRYSATKDRLLWIDDISISGSFYADVLPPEITKCEASGRNLVEVIFSEETAEDIIIPENISLNNGENKTLSVIKINNLLYWIEFEDNLVKGTQNVLHFLKLCDLSDNCSQNVSAVFTPEWAGPGDVAISEIMADPSPEISLPPNEYLEITNRTSNTINLKNWKLSTESQSSVFPDAILPPSGIIILCSSSDTLLFKKYGRTVGLKQFPILNDDGKLLYISDSTGAFIHGVEYTDKWYRDELKSNGGWSLEMEDLNFPFYYEDNWKASESRLGGTPGSANSVRTDNPDISFYGIDNVSPEDSVTIHVRFSEPVFDLTADNGMIKIGNKSISEVFPDDPLFRRYTIKLKEPIEKTVLYKLEISGTVTDFAGNTIQKNSVDFGLPEAAESGDILFNEILFNPFPGDPDYLELYNNSQKILDASRLQIVSVNDEGEKSEPVVLSDEPKCILPGEYYAITTDPKRVSERYFSTDPDHLFQVGSLPSMSDDKGHLILYNRELDQIDELVYDDKMQLSLLSDPEGVALEKTGLGSKSEERGNWHSATESSGWGTPGARNSVFTKIEPGSDQVEFSSTKITPNNDGFEDFLTIRLNLKGNGNVISVTVYDEAGNFIRKLASNLFAGAEASIIWDGTADDGSALTTGIYIILINLYDESGKTEKWKKVCTVIR